jgi:cation transport regulator ChaB
LSYHSQGAFTQEIVYKLPVHLRLFYINKLIEAKEKEKEEIERAKNGRGSSPASIPKGPVVKK